MEHNNEKVQERHNHQDTWTDMERMALEAKKTSRAVWTKAITYILAGLGLVVGLAWNDAVQALVAAIFPLEKNSIVAKFIYASVITIVLVVISMRLAKEEND